MFRNGRAPKTLVLITVGAYFGYAFYWFVKSLFWIIQISLRPENYHPSTGFLFINSQSVTWAYVMEYSGFLGLTIRVVGASFSLLAAFLFWKTETSAFETIKDKVSKSLLLEGIYFLTFIPSIYFLLNFSALPAASNTFLSISFISQILLISPLFVSLSAKTMKHKTGLGEASLLRLAGLAALGYVVALWITYFVKMG